MNKLRRLLLIITTTSIGSTAFAQFDESGIAAGFFDSSKEKDINYSEFHLPPLSILFENAKSTPQIMTLEKARQIAQAEVAKQKRHIFSYLTGHASYSYGMADMWGNNSSSYNQMIYHCSQAISGPRAKLLERWCSSGHPCRGHPRPDSGCQA